MAPLSPFANSASWSPTKSVASSEVVNLEMGETMTLSVEDIYTEIPSNRNIDKPYQSEMLGRGLLLVSTTINQFHNDTFFLAILKIHL